MKNVTQIYIAHFLIAFCCPALQAMKQSFVWDADQIKKIYKNDKIQLYADIQDSKGQTPLLHLILNNTHKNFIHRPFDNSHGFYDSFKCREYAYDPNFLKNIISISNVNRKDIYSKTFLDYFLSNAETYNVSGVNHHNEALAVNYNAEYPYEKKQTYLSTEYANYSLFQYLLDHALASGYNFYKNPQTTLELLGEKFSDMETIIILLKSGIACGTTFDYFSSKKIKDLRYKCAKYDAFIENYKASKNENLKIALTFEYDQDFLELLFKRAISRNTPIVFKLLNQTTPFPDAFTPLEAFKQACNMRQYNSLPYIFKSFSRMTLYNLLARICNKETIKRNLENDEKSYDEIMYEFCKNAQHNGYYNFLNKVALIAALRCYRKNKKQLEHALISHILDYVEL